MLSLGMSHESKNLFLRVGWHKGCLVVSDRNLSNEVEESLSGGIFSSRLDLQVARCNAYCLCLLRVHCEEIVPVKQGYF